MRLIDADALWERLDYEPWEHNADRDSIALPLVVAAPTVDAVQIIRCKDCKHLRPNVDAYTQETVGYWCSELDIGSVDVDDLCSYGERKEN